MNPQNKVPPSPVDVDWDAPEMQQILQRIEGLRLDDRGTFKPRPVRVYPGWNPPENQRLWLPAQWVGETKSPATMVLALPAPLLRAGESVTIDKSVDDLRIPWIYAQVDHCRGGVRAEDRKSRTQFVWAILRTR